MMIDYHIDKIPKSNLSISDFPYFEDYFQYLTVKINNFPNRVKFTDFDAEKLKLLLIESPNYDTHFIDSYHRQVVVFDMSVSFLMLEFNSVLNNGFITKSFWDAILTFASSQFTHLEFSYISLAHTINKNSINCLLTDFKPLKIDNYCNISNLPSISINIQEMFMLAHEMSHQFLSIGIFNQERFNEIMKDIYKYSEYNLTSQVFFSKLNGIISCENKDEEKIFEKFRLLLSNREFIDEILCDLASVDLTIEYFTLDCHNESIYDTAASIKVALYNTFILNKLKSKIIGNFQKINKENNYQLLLRLQIVDTYLSKVVYKQNNDDDIIFFSSLYSEIIRKRSTAIIQNIFPYLFETIDELECVGNSLFPYFEDLKQSALYYAGYYTNSNNSYKFSKTDGSVFFNEDLKEKIESEIDITLYKRLSEFPLDNYL